MAAEQRALLRHFACVNTKQYDIISPVHTGDKVEFNTVDFVESPLLSATKSTVADTVNFVAGFGNKSATTWIRQFVAVDFVADTFNFVVDTFNFVASVYGVKATRSTMSTFNKIDCVEFNFVVSVYRALDVLNVRIQPEKHGYIMLSATCQQQLNLLYLTYCDCTARYLLFMTASCCLLLILMISSRNTSCVVRVSSFSSDLTTR